MNSPHGKLPYVPLTPEGNVPVVLTLEGAQGDPIRAYGEALSVASGVEVDVLTYTVPVGKRLTLFLAEGTGTNFSRYTLEADAERIARAWTYVASALTSTFHFGPGIRFPSGATLVLRAIHTRPSPGEFTARIVGVLEDTT